MNIKTISILLASLTFSGLSQAQTPGARLTGKGVVTVDKQGSSFVLKRDGKPYYVKGIGGQKNLEIGAACGANSIRTWGSENAAALLDKAQALGLTATVGIWLDHNGAKYHDEAYKTKIRTELQGLIAKVKNHPAMLVYALGNETNSGADTPEAWKFINELAEMVHKEDPNHPTMTVLAGSSQKTINNVAQYAPAIDILGVNAYRGVVVAPRDVEASQFKGPYMITEWGPWGHWEVGKTAWGAPLEQNSAEKAKSYEATYKLLLDHKNRCVGSYVFLWGQKQERTPTWYGMFVEENPALGLKGEATPSVDVMTAMWSGKPPANSAPAIGSVTANGGVPSPNLTVAAGKELNIKIKATDPNNDKLTYAWEVLPEATQLGNGGSFEPRPKGVPGGVKASAPGEAKVTVANPGNYRVFGYVLDGKGKVATVNVPFQVK